MANVKNACDLACVVMAEIGAQAIPRAQAARGNGQKVDAIDVLRAQLELPSPLAVAAACEALIRQAHALDRLNEVECNRGLTPGETARQERLEKRVREIAADLGLSVKFNSDPRGASVRLLLPCTKRYNTWGGEEEGWAVL